RADPVGEPGRRHDPRHPRSAHGAGEPVTAPVLQVDDLVTSFPADASFAQRAEGERRPAGGGRAAVVDGLSLSIAAGEVLALVGESGCGKSVTALSILRLVPKPGRIESGRVTLGGRDLATLSVSEMR